MKINDRFPSVGVNEIDEKKLETNKYKGPDSTNRNIYTIPRDVFENLPTPPSNPFEGFLRGLANDLRDQNNPAPQISSPVEKYKGPDSLKLPEIESKVEKYKGPDSIQRPKIESEVSKYKGPDSLPQEPKIESEVNKYKGPNSTNKNVYIFPEVDFENLPGPYNNSDLPGLRNELESHIRTSGNFAQTSAVESEVEKYKGPDSIELTPSKNKSNR